MKKLLTIIVMLILLITSLTSVGAIGQEVDTQDGLLIAFNGEASEYTSVILNGTHYIPLRKVFEKMGAVVFYRGRDNQILALTRDGEMISHIVGTNKIVVNTREKVFENPSISRNHQTYIPLEMMTAALCPDGIFYDNQQLNIQKQIFNNDYHKVVKNIFDLSGNSDFYPERYKRYLDYYVKNPAYSAQDVIKRVNIGLDFPFYENITTIERPYELLVLVNKYNQLPSQFNQYNLVEMDPRYTLRDGKDYLLAGVTYEKYKEMWDAAKKEGLSMMVVSAYRTENYQRNLYNSKVRTSGKAYADDYSARAGHSEHQTGLAIDIGSTFTSFEYSAEFKWLESHAHEYGFILRYPKGKEWITGYAYEPWHYRFVGVSTATKIHEEGLTFEEYHAKYKIATEFK